MEPLVSVIIPCYNGELFLDNAIQSAMAQTYKNVEIILIDDGSTDSTRHILNEYAKHKNIKVLFNKSNKGIPYSRNRGIDIAKGEYISFLDQDDIWLPSKTESQIRKLKKHKNNIGLVFSDIFYISDGNYFERSWPKRAIPKEINSMSIEKQLKALYIKNFIPIITTMIPRLCLDSVGYFNESLKGGADDYELFLRIAGRYNILFVNEKLAIKRIHERNYSNEKMFINDEFRIIGIMEKIYPELKELRDEKKNYLYERLGNLYIEIGNKKAACEAFSKIKASYLCNPKICTKIFLANLDYKLHTNFYGLLKRIRNIFIEDQSQRKK